MSQSSKKAVHGKHVTRRYIFVPNISTNFTWYNSVFLVVGLPKEDLKFYIDSLKKERGEQGPVRVSYETLDAETAFYWRCLGEHFKSMGTDGEALLDELLPEVSGFCKYIQGYESQKINYAISVISNKLYKQCHCINLHIITGTQCIQKPYLL